MNRKSPCCIAACVAEGAGAEFDAQVCGLYDCGLHHQNQMIDKEKELREDEN
jgi:hypothetical protein